MLYKSKIFRYAICPIVLLASMLWAVITFRILSIIVLIAVLGIYATLSMHKNTKLLITLWVIFLILSFIPFSITFMNVPGPPRIVPYLIGYPTPDLLEEAQKGNLVCGGCSYTGLEPEWVLVW
jgi:hypothetical protein